MRIIKVFVTINFDQQACVNKYVYKCTDITYLNFYNIDINNRSLIIRCDYRNIITIIN